MFEELVKSGSVKRVVVNYSHREYPVNGMKVFPTPEWYHNLHDTVEKNRIISPSREKLLELVMRDCSLAEDIDNKMASSGSTEAQYADLICTTESSKAEITGASIISFRGTEVSLLGGVYCWDATQIILADRKRQKIEAIERDQPDLTRFRLILEELEG